MAANFNIARRSSMLRDCQEAWRNCYDSGWQGEIVPEAFVHPAKFSRALIRRIYDHAFEEGWLAPGMTVVDPFAGVGLGALDAMWNGLDWVGCELEPKFHQIGGEGWQCPGTLGEPRYIVFKPEKPDPNKKLGWPICDACIKAWKLWEHRPEHHAMGNLERWRLKYRLGTARIIQGDSRKLAEVIAGVDLVCSSPPYEGSMNSEKHGIDWTKVKKDYPGRVMHEERIINLKKNHNERMYGFTD